MGIGENKLKRCVSINISEGEVLEKDLDLGEIYDLLMIIGKINLKRTKSFKNRFYKLVRLVTSRGRIRTAERIGDGNKEGRS